jgi:hypothetical protein
MPQPCALWPVTLRGALGRAVVDDKVRKVSCEVAVLRSWIGHYSPMILFFNVNDPIDLLTAEAILLSRKKGNCIMAKLSSYNLRIYYLFGLLRRSGQKPRIQGGCV